MSAPVLHRCSNHRADPAGWRCPACKKLLCGKCTAEDREMFYCVECEGRVTQFTRPRSDKPFGVFLGRAAMFPVTGGLVQTALVALLLTVSGSVERFVEKSPGIRSLFKPAQNADVPGGVNAADAVTAPETPPPATPPPPTPEDATLDTGPEATPEKKAEPATPEARLPPVKPIYFTVVRVSGSLFRTTLLFLFAFFVASGAAWGAWAQRGKARRLMQTIAATMIVWVPGLAYLVLLHGKPPDATLGRDWAVWLFAGLCFVYLPACVAGTAGEVGPSNFNPFAMFRWVWQLGLRYLVTLIMVGGLLAIAILVATAAPAATFLNALALQFVFCASVAVMAWLIGALSHVYGYIYGWETKERFADPILEGVRAEGILKRWSEQRAAIDDLIRTSGEKNKVVEPGTQAARLAVRKIEEAIASGGVSVALRTYEQQAEWPPGVLKDETAIELAMAAQRAKKIDIARKLLVPVAEKKGLSAARARLMLGLLLGTIPGEEAAATAMLESLVADFPKTEFARQAEAKLANK